MADYIEGSETLEVLGLFSLGEGNDLSESRAFADCNLSLKPLREMNDGSTATLLDRIKEIINEEQLFISPELVAQIAIGLIHGHVILYGPPGTGKTSLVRVLAKLFRTHIPQIWTANPEWTTFDVIGGLTPTIIGGKEVIVGKLGKVTGDMVRCIENIKSFEEDNKDTFQAAWCVIDEMNRCDLDKAFGDLFTALSSGDIENKQINLPFMQNDEGKHLYVPGQFRLIGTINTYDKDFIQDFSVALSRRFRFFPVDIPAREDLKKEVELLWNRARVIVLRRIAEWGVTETSLSELRKALENINGVNVWNEFEALIDYIRWNGDMGIPIGSSQVTDVLIGLVTQLFILEKVELVTSPKDDAEKTSALAAVLDALDQSIAESLVKQFDSDSVTGLNELMKRLSTSSIKFRSTGPTLTELRRLVKENELI